jgi:hypothetical protein
MPTVNIEAMKEHLKEISTQVAPGAHAVPNNITLMPLPLYAPELNPMGNIWDYLRGNKLSRLVWDSYEAIVAACKDAWDFLMGDPERIQSIAHRSWAWVNLYWKIPGIIGPEVNGRITVGVVEIGVSTRRALADASGRLI